MAASIKNASLVALYGVLEALRPLLGAEVEALTVDTRRQQGPAQGSVGPAGGDCVSLCARVGSLFLPSAGRVTSHLENGRLRNGKFFKLRRNLDS